jgi:CheY-like chemotaxis protein
VLFVDDDARSRVLVQAFRRLAKKAHVRHVCSGVDALVEVGRKVPDVIFLDIFMPGIDGLEVLRRLAKNSVTRSVRVVAMSASDDPELERQAVDAGAEALLRKPVKARQLVALLGRKACPPPSDRAR